MDAEDSSLEWLRFRQRLRATCAGAVRAQLALEEDQSFARFPSATAAFGRRKVLDAALAPNQPVDIGGVRQASRWSVGWPPLCSAICTRPVPSLAPRSFTTLNMEGSDRVKVFIDTIVDDVRDPVLVEVLGEPAWTITAIDEIDPDPGGSTIAPAALPIFLVRIFVAVRRVLSKHPPEQHRIRRDMWSAPAEADDVSASEKPKHRYWRYGTAMANSPPLSMPHKRTPFTRVVWLIGDAGELYGGRCRRPRTIGDSKPKLRSQARLTLP